VGQHHTKFPILPGDVYQYGLSNGSSNMFQLTTVLDFDSSPNDHVLCSLKNQKIIEAAGQLTVHRSSEAHAITASAPNNSVLPTTQLSGIAEETSTAPGYTTTKEKCFHFQLVNSEISIGTRNEGSEQVDVSVKDIKMASLHATLRKWKDTYYLDPDSQARHTYHCIGRAPCYNRGPCPLDVNDVFRIGKNEIRVCSIINADKYKSEEALAKTNQCDTPTHAHHQTSSVRNLDGFRVPRKRSSMLGGIPGIQGVTGVPGVSTSNTTEEEKGTELTRSKSEEEGVQHQWSTRFSSIPIEEHDSQSMGSRSGTGSGGASSTTKRKSHDSGGLSRCSSSLGNSHEEWFGYQGAPLSGDLFRKSRQSSSSTDTPTTDPTNEALFGGAFQYQGLVEQSAVPKHKKNMPRISLEVIRGPIRGQLFTIAQGVATIGRLPQNTIVIPDRSVSAIHASIRFRQGVFYLTDMNSLSGTFTLVQVDDGVALERGDTFVMGGTEMTVYTKHDEDDSGTRGKAGGCCVVA